MITDKIYFGLVLVGEAALLALKGKAREAFYVLHQGKKLLSRKAQYYMDDSCVRVAMYGACITIIILVITLTLLLRCWR